VEGGGLGELQITRSTPKTSWPHPHGQATCHDLAGNARKLLSYASQQWCNAEQCEQPLWPKQKKLLTEMKESPDGLAHKPRTKPVCAVSVLKHSRLGKLHKRI